MTFISERDRDEVDELHSRALDALDEGSKFPGMSYEEGVAATLDWLSGNVDEDPLSNE